MPYKRPTRPPNCRALPSMFNNNKINKRINNITICECEGRSNKYMKSKDLQTNCYRRYLGELPPTGSHETYDCGICSGKYSKYNEDKHRQSDKHQN